MAAADSHACAEKKSRNFYFQKLHMRIYVKNWNRNIDSKYFLNLHMCCWEYQIKYGLAKIWTNFYLDIQNYKIRNFCILSYSLVFRSGIQQKQATTS